MPRLPLFTRLSIILPLALLGCTRIETPYREEASDAGPLVVVPERDEILDTQPIALEARGGKGDVTWSSTPALDRLFSPERGRKVLFTPPDLAGEAAITVRAADEAGNRAEACIGVTDQGGPPDPGDILINEIAWAGTLSGASDEYIELVNRSGKALYLDGWTVDNAAGVGFPLVFRGRLEARGFFLIANYESGSERTAIRARIDFPASKLSLSNSAFGPFTLRDRGGAAYDTVGDGGGYPSGLNTQDARASMARYTSSSSLSWDPRSWYTESVSLDLVDGTFGTPGARNSDLPLSQGGGSGGARAVIAEFSVDAHDAVGEDWVELYVIEGGNAKDFVLTDLDGSDSSISGGVDAFVDAGTTLLVVWSGAAGRNGDTFFIPDSNPTGARDELVLTRAGAFLDGLCYSTDGSPPDDHAALAAHGWNGEPIRGAYGARLTDGAGGYEPGLDASCWTASVQPTPGERNWD